MVATLATASWIGVELDEKPCAELAKRLGRPFAALVGICVYLITACFQFSNNQGMLASIEPLVPFSKVWQVAFLLAFNGTLIACLFCFKQLYQSLERLMAVLVGLMLVGFVANLILAQPSLLELLKGMFPILPEQLQGNFLPILEAPTLEAGGTVIKGQINDPWLVVQGLVATTLSIAAAFYQAYLVKEKGWQHGDLKRGLFDSVLGTSLLIGISLTIMITSAAVLYGRVQPSELRSVADVAQQLEPLFGSTAKWLFCLGIFGGAASSFLVNALIGGTLLADGLGIDARLDSIGVKTFAASVLIVGMLVALLGDAENRVSVIIVAQAFTVLGGPILAISLLYLARCCKSEGKAPVPFLLQALTSVGACVVFLLAARTAWRLYLTFQS